VPDIRFCRGCGPFTRRKRVAVANVGLAPSLSTSAPSGTYYIRAYAQNAFGSSGPSNEVTVRVTGAPSEICRQVTAVLTPAPYGDPEKPC
jgi:hypothetical protein